MSNIEQNLAKILSSRYGRDVRQSIHDSIHDCYEDGKAGAVDLVAREQIANLVANVPSGSTKDSELVDIRIGADGTQYTSAGEAVRGQINNTYRYQGNINLNDSDIGNIYLKDYTENGTYAFHTISEEDVDKIKDLPPVKEKVAPVAAGNYTYFLLENKRGFSYGNFVLQTITFGRSGGPSGYEVGPVFTRLVKIGGAGDNDYVSEWIDCGFPVEMVAGAYRYRNFVTFSSTENTDKKLSDLLELGTYGVRISPTADYDFIGAPAHNPGVYILENKRGFDNGHYIEQTFYNGYIQNEADSVISPTFYKRFIKTIPEGNVVYNWMCFRHVTGYYEKDTYRYQGNINLNDSDIGNIYLKDYTENGTYAFHTISEEDVDKIKDLPPVKEKVAPVAAGNYTYFLLENKRGFSYGNFVLQTITFGRSGGPSGYEVGPVFTRLVKIGGAGDDDYVSEWIDCGFPVEMVAGGKFIGKRLSIIGDSISTYQGYIPDGYATWYPRSNVDDVSKTWWKKLCDATGLTLLSNASWSGSKCTGDSTSETNASAGCSTARVNDLSVDGVEPDIVIVFIGINDFAPSNVPVGTWTAKDPIPEESTSVSTFSEAYSLMISKILNKYKACRVFCCGILLSGSSSKDEDDPGVYPTKNGNGTTLDEYNAVIKNVCEGLGCDYIDLTACGINFWNFSKTTVDSLHPNALGASLVEKKIEAELIAKY